MKITSKLKVDDGAARCRVEDDRLVMTGSMTADNIDRLPRDAARIKTTAKKLRLDVGTVSTVDMAGAWWIERTRRGLADRGIELDLTGLTTEQKALLELVSDGVPASEIPQPERHGMLEDIGRDTIGVINSQLAFLGFIGGLTFSAVRIALTPATLRWSMVIDCIEEDGFDALPIVGLLSFLMGLVIAYQGGILLRDYGGSIFTADLVGLAMLRELSPLITAIIVAGRTGSAYTAEIATMKVTDEVDALRTMGIAPLEVLALPKFYGLVIVLPLLTVYADFMALLGGMIMSNSLLGISFTSFIDRITYSVSVESFLIGVGKAPVFAMMIAAVGCYQGFQTDGAAEQVGKHTTISVVQSIFLVIVVDAIFSIVFSKVGI